MKSLRDIEDLGWIFYLILSLLLTPVCIYLVYRYTYSSAGAFSRTIMGVVSAFLLGGVLSAFANEALHYFRARNQKLRRKEIKRKKRG